MLLFSDRLQPYHVVNIKTTLILDNFLMTWITAEVCGGCALHVASISANFFDASYLGKCIHKALSSANQSAAF